MFIDMKNNIVNVTNHSIVKCHRIQSDRRIRSSDIIETNTKKLENQDKVKEVFYLENSQTFSDEF